MTENDKADLQFIYTVLNTINLNKARAKLIKKYFDGKYNLKGKENELQRTEKRV